jgi:hypothetical protein
MYPYTVAAFPTRTNANPGDTSTWTYANEPGVIGYVLGQGNKRRLFTSYGALRGFELGTYREFHSDQTGRYLGFWKIVGVVNVGEGTRDGHIPNRKVPHWVCK